MVKNLPAMQETWVLSLSWEDAPEEDMAIHSSILAGKIPWTKEPGGLQSIGSTSFNKARNMLIREVSESLRNLGVVLRCKSRLLAG